jgi:hypothetical protein
VEVLLLIRVLRGLMPDASGCVGHFRAAFFNGRGKPRINEWKAVEPIRRGPSLRSGIANRGGTMKPPSRFFRSLQLLPTPHDAIRADGAPLLHASNGGWPCGSCLERERIAGEGHPARHAGDSVVGVGRLRRFAKAMEGERLGFGVGMTRQEDAFLIVLFVFVCACLGIAAFSVTIIARRRMEVIPGKVVGGWRAVCLGVLILLFSPVILFGVVFLLTYVRDWSSQ